jgi:hypothetical protein
MAYDRLNSMTKLTKKEVLDLNNALHRIGDLDGVQFAYAVSKNIVKLKTEIIALQTAFAPKPEFMVFENARLDLEAKKDKKTFEKKMEALKKKHKKVISEREKQVKEFELLLEEEIEIDLRKVLLSNIPEKITTTQMSGILPIVTEDLTK